MIGTPNGFFSMSHSTLHDHIRTLNDSTDDLNHQRSMSNSPVDDGRKSSPSKSTIGNVKKGIYDCNWFSGHGPFNYATYDNNENLTNTPLNLSLSGNDALEAETISHATPQLLSLPNSSAVAQLVLTSGQMVQGIQGAQLFVPTSQGLAKQIVLTIPITHVTTNQVINLTLSNGRIIPTTVGELIKLTMPKNIFEDAIIGEKKIGELMKLSEQTSAYIAEYSKCALKHNNKKNYSENKQKSESESDSVGEKEFQDNVSLIYDKTEIEQEDTEHNTSLKTQDQNSNYGHLQEQIKISNRRKPVVINGFKSNHQTNKSLKHKIQERIRESIIQNDRPQKALNHTLASKDFPTNSGPIEIGEEMISTITREDPSAINRDTENSFQYDNVFKSERTSTDSSYDGNDFSDIKEFAKSFKLRRLSMGLTQTQVGQALNIAEGPAYSQSAICSALASNVYAAQIASQQHSMFEKLDITPKSAQKIKPVLERWMKEAEERCRNGQGLLTEFIGMESSKKRKRRTSFTPQALEILNSHFEHNTHPSGAEITTLAHQLGYDREVIRIWFCNKRQALKNSVHMMSRHMM